jgi:hypothetical protein
MDRIRLVVEELEERIAPGALSVAIASGPDSTAEVDTTNAAAPDIAVEEAGADTAVDIG